jgi:hypothetical protein
MSLIFCFLSIYLILPTALGPGVYSASNRNEYQKQKNVSREYSAAGARLTTSQAIYEPFVYMQCGTLNISQPYTPP